MQRKDSDFLLRRNLLLKTGAISLSLLLTQSVQKDSGLTVLSCVFFSVSMGLRLLPWLVCFGMGISRLSQLQNQISTGSCSVQRVVLKATKAALRTPTGAFCWKEKGRGVTICATSEEHCTLPGDAPCLQAWLTLAQFLACIPTCYWPLSMWCGCCSVRNREPSAGSL